jgi:hypothetical protein
MLRHNKGNKAEKGTESKSVIYDSLQNHIYEFRIHLHKDHILNL